jgi:hypothetical protein
MAKTGTFVYRNGKLVPKHSAGPLIRSDAAPMVISDIAPYRASAADKATGKRPVIGGRRQHREFLQANGYRELGNEMPVQRREEMPREQRVSDIRAAMRDA